MDDSQPTCLSIVELATAEHGESNVSAPSTFSNHASSISKSSVTSRSFNGQFDSHAELPLAREAGSNESELASVHSALFSAYRAQMRLWCRNAMSGPIGARLDTSDVVQESLVQVWRDWDRMKEKSSGEIQAWMYQIARGHLNKLKRHHLAGKRNIRRTEPTRTDNSEGPAVDPDNHDPQQSLLKAERRLQVMIALERLPADLAEVVKLRLFAMCSFREIGERMQMDRAEARYRFLRALRRLKSLLAEVEGGNDS